MKHKKSVLIVVGVVIFLNFVTYFIYEKNLINKLPFLNKEAEITTTEATIEAMKVLPPLKNTEEIALQKQLQDIVASGEESSCVKLDDLRYQFACHEFFKNIKK